jgi:hypothetical protein
MAFGNPGQPPQGTPPPIPGVTQLSPERANAMDMNQGDNGPPENEQAKQAIPQLIAAQASLLQQAADLGPEVFDQVSSMATAYIKILQKKVGLDQMQPQQQQGQQGPPMGTPPPQNPAQGGQQTPGEDPRAAFLSALMSGGQM